MGPRALEGTGRGRTKARSNPTSKRKKSTPPKRSRHTPKIASECTQAGAESRFSSLPLGTLVVTPFPVPLTFSLPPLAAPDI